MSDAGFIAHVLDVLGQCLDQVRARAMFGGHGIYHGDVMFALIADDRLYFKADEASKPQFEAAGSRPFVYDGGSRKPVTMSYWEAPEDALDDADELRPWARLGLDAALRGKKRQAGR